MQIFYINICMVYLTLWIAFKLYLWGTGNTGISSSNSDEIETEFIIDKYREDDTDPMRFKVTCVPVDKSGKFGLKKYYSCDLVSLIVGGTIKIIN